MNFKNNIKKFICFLLMPLSRFNDIYYFFDKVNTWFSYRFLLARILAKANVNLVIDVGANEGQFAKSIRMIYKSKIISFEPVRKVYEKLNTETLKDNNWTAYNLALGSENTVSEINVTNHTVLSSLLNINKYCKEQFGHDSVIEAKEIITIKRLDDFFLEIEGILGMERIFLKLDTQGFDLEVFRGLGDLIDNVCVIQAEVPLIPIYEEMVHWTKSIEVFEDAGFKVVGMFPVTKDGEKVIEYDCILIKDI